MGKVIGCVGDFHSMDVLKFTVVGRADMGLGFQIDGQVLLGQVDS